MTETHDPLARLRIASPCNESWDGMRGDDRVRHCDACRLDVFNLSAMSRDEAQALVAGREGRLCVRMFQRTDGTLLTRDCPVGRARLRERARRAVARVAAAVGFAFTSLLGACSGARPEVEPEPETPATTVPKADPVEIMGDICVEPLQGEVLVEPPRELLGRVMMTPVPDQPDGR